MLRIQDPETDASLDLHVPPSLEEAFRVQIWRHLDSGGGSSLPSEMAGWLAVALYQLVDRDLLPPTERQRGLAEHICRVLGLDMPDEAHRFRGTMSDFIRAHLTEFHAQCPPPFKTP